MALNPATNRQVPDQSILDHFDRQTYLGNQFVYAIPTISPGVTTEFPLLLLTNPAVPGSSFPSAYKALFCNIRNVICLTANQTAIFRIYAGPTVSAAGTAKTPANLRLASPNTPVAVITQQPTVSPNGTLIDTIGSSNLVETISTSPLIVIDPGKQILVTVQASLAAANVSMELGWFEL